MLKTRYRPHWSLAEFIADFPFPLCYFLKSIEKYRELVDQWLGILEVLFRSIILNEE